MNVLRWCPFVHLFDTTFQNSPYGHAFHKRLGNKELQFFSSQFQFFAIFTGFQGIPQSGLSNNIFKVLLLNTKKGSIGKNVK